jgi:gamma-glutamyltranspeptidase
MKKATIDKDRCIGDPRFFNVPLDQLLSKTSPEKWPSRSARAIAST